MEKKAFFKNTIYTVTSNLITLLIATFVTFFIPRFIGVETYGYFQLYVFYTGYIGFFHFGWADGVLLRYGGEKYESLDYAKMSGQFWALSFVELLFSIVVIVFAFFYIPSEQKTAVIMCTGTAIILVLPRTLLLFILQCTNRIKEYSVVLIIEKVIYFIGIIIVLAVELRDFKPLLMADIVGKATSFIIAMHYCKSIVLAKPESIQRIIAETKLNINAGIKLMISSIASMLIIGIVRFSIERQWDVAVFGKISLTLSLSNILMVVIGAISIVLFPMLKRTEREQYGRIYYLMRECLMIILLGMLMLYYPFKELMSIWLPQYADSLKYMAILFPICIFESKYTMLIMTYLKALRKEKWLLMINVAMVCVSACVTFVVIFMMNNLDLSILSIVIFMGIRCVTSEILLSSLIDINILKDNICEILLITIFIISSWFFNEIVGFAIYVSMYLIYIFIKRNGIIAIKKVLMSNRRA